MAIVQIIKIEDFLVYEQCNKKTGKCVCVISADQPFSPILDAISKQNAHTESFKKIEFSWLLEVVAQK